MKHPLFIIVILVLAVSCTETTPIEQLKAQNKIENSYHLYASTLRMLNFQDVESYDKLVRDVEKLSFIVMKPDSFEYEDLLAFSNKLQHEKGYDTYLEIEDTERQYYILGKESPDKTIVLINQGGSQYIIDMVGHPNFLELPRLMNSLSEIDSSETSGISMLYDLINEDAAKEERRRKYREERALKKKREEEEKQLKRDSMARDSANLTIEPLLD